MKYDYDDRNPWHYGDGEILTPEDIQDAINAGASELELYKVVLIAIASKKCEDSSCCAFVAARFKKS